MNEKQWLKKIEKDLVNINKKLDLHDKQGKKSKTQEADFLKEQLIALMSSINDLSMVMVKYDVEIPYCYFYKILV